MSTSTLSLTTHSSQSPASTAIDELYVITVFTDTYLLSQFFFPNLVSSWPSTPGPVATLATHFNTTSSDGNTMNSASLFVGVGVATLSVLITAAVIIITVLVCLKKNRLNITYNVAYQSSTSEVKLFPNAAYTATDDNSPTSPYQEYTYVTPDTTSTQQDNTTTSSNRECDIITITNEAYVATTCNISTSTNQAYEAAQCQSGSETLTYDYVINN